MVIGRERLLAPEVLPPLRFESLIVLAAASRWSLAQSFQRRSLFAGKLHSGSDWAPILLSDELQGTEFGSLLDLADQILKSWSMNGEVAYQAFGHPLPGRWADRSPVIDALNTNQLTFNWNTNGVTTLTRDGRFLVLTVQRTGSLPVTYIPEKVEAPRIAEIEDRYREYFASLENPLLVRVVAYTALYEAFQVFRIGASCVARVAGERAGESLLEDRARAFVSSVRRRDRGLRDLARSRLGSVSDRSLDNLKKLFDDVHRQLGDDGLTELVHHLAGVRGASGLARVNRGLVDLANQITSDAGFGELARAILDRDAAMSDFAGAARPLTTPWLRTPTVVLSSVRVGENVYAVGGHNIDVRPIEVAVSPSATRRQPQISVDNGRTVLTVHPDDLASVSDLTPTLKKVQDGRITQAAAQAEAAASLAHNPLRTVRAMPVALGRGDLTVYWAGRPASGWAVAHSPAGKSGPTAASRMHAGGLVRLRRKLDGYELQLPGQLRNPESFSSISLVEKVNGFLATTDEEDIRIQLEGFTPDQAAAFGRTVKLRWNHGVKSKLLAISNGDPAMDRPVDPRRVQLTIQPPRPVDVAGAPMFECDVHIKERNLLVRIALYFKAKIAQPVLDRIHDVVMAVLNRTNGTAGQVARDIRAELRASFSEATVDVFVESENSCDYIIATRTPDAQAALR